MDTKFYIVSHVNTNWRWTICVKLWLHLTFMQAHQNYDLKAVADMVENRKCSNFQATD